MTDGVEDELSLHHGLIRRRRALALGLTPSAIQAERGAGAWVSVHRGIYRHAAAPVTEHQTLLAAVWAGGPSAVASHRSAAWLWGMIERAPDRPEITVASGRLRQASGTSVRQSRDLVSGVSRRSGIPTTDPLRTLVELGATAGQREVEAALDRARSSRLVTLDGVEATLVRFGRSGRNGTAVLRRALERIGPSAHGRPPSVLESRLARVFPRYGLPTPVPEHVAGPGGCYRIDFAYPLIKLAVEADSDAWHGADRRLKADTERQNTLTEEGWTFLRFGWDIVHRRPDAVASRIRALHTRLGPALHRSDAP